MVNFFLTDFYFNCNMNKCIVKYKKKHPEWFRDGCNIAGIYGIYPSSIWNGEYFVYGGADRENIIETTKVFNDDGIPLVLEYTSSVIDEFTSMVYDNISNLQCKLCENDMNMITITSDTLREFIHANYPKYEFIASSARLKYTTKDLEAELDNDAFKYVIVNTVFNNDKAIERMDNKDRMILVINDPHKFCCPNYHPRQKYVSELQMNLGLTVSENCCEGCTAIEASFFELMQRKQFISVEDVYGKYQDAGIDKFYIAGRPANKLDLLEAYMYYLIKPEHRDAARLRMMIDLQ